jgi:hypothetical protein
MCSAGPENLKVTKAPGGTYVRQGPQNRGKFWKGVVTVEDPRCGRCPWVEELKLLSILGVRFFCESSGAHPISSPKWIHMSTVFWERRGTAASALR